MDNIISSIIQSVLGVGTVNKPTVLIPVDLPSFVKPGMIFEVNSILNLNSTSNDLFGLKLQNDFGEFFDVEIKLSEAVKINDIQNNIQGQKVKVVNGGKLQIISLKKDSLVDSKTGITTSKNVSSPIEVSDFRQQKIDLPPLRVSSLVEKLMNEMDFPIEKRSEIIKLIEFVDVIPVLKNIGENISYNSELLTPIKQVLQKMMQGDMALGLDKQNLQNQLIQEVKNLNGNVLPLKIIPQQLQDKLISFDTPLGRIWSNQILNVPAETPLQAEIKVVENIFKSEFVIKLKSIVEELKRQIPEKNVFMIEEEELVRSLAKPNNSFIELIKVLEPLIKSMEAESVLKEVIVKLPGIKADLISNLFSFYRAVQMHDVTEWLGPDLYNKMSENPIGKEVLSNIENLMTTVVKDTPMWKITEIPFFDGGQIFMWRIAVTKDSKEENKKNNLKKGKRFIIDTEFTNLGGFQFEGYASTKERRFDLVIRTTLVHDEDFCMQIMNLFKKSLHDVDYVGTIRINQKEDFIQTDDVKNISKKGVYI